MHSCDKKKTTSSDARENDSAANRNTNAAALRIIIDSPAYNYMVKKNSLIFQRVFCCFDLYPVGIPYQLLK